MDFQTLARPRQFTSDARTGALFHFTPSRTIAAHAIPARRSAGSSGTIWKMTKPVQSYCTIFPGSIGRRFRSPWAEPLQRHAADIKSLPGQRNIFRRLEVPPSLECHGN
jgi:hypothetical protein